MKTVKAVLNYYLTHRGPSVVDLARIEYCVANLTEKMGRMAYTSLTPHVCRQFEAKRIKEGIGAGTIRRELSCLSTALRFNLDDGVIDVMPKLYLTPKPAPKDRWLTRDDVNLLIQCASPRIRLFIQIALATGGRPEAIDALTWHQVDMVNWKIDFNEPGRVQTAKRRPVVPISEYLKREMVDAHVSRTSMYVLATPASTRRGFETARRKAGLVWSTRKTLRHTYATWASQAGVDLWKIAGVLGDSVHTVERNYAHHHPDYLVDAVNF